VIVTGHSDPDLPAAAKRAGASAIVQKLAPDADLEDVILGALSGRRWKDDGG